MAGRLRLAVPDFVHNAIDSQCPSWWKEGCGCNACFGACADGLEVINPFVEQCSQAIWCLGSPLAFPLIFCFSAEPHTNETSGYDISMMSAPCKHPCIWAFSSVCFPCGQWYVRRQVLGGDMTKYKLWQGYHDGPQCFARTCPGAPITIEAGTYGEQDCPNLFLCLEVNVLGGVCSPCCAFDVSRRYQRQERGLKLDPTEARHHKCVSFFSQIMHSCRQMGMCLCISGCLVGTCAPDSEGGQDFAHEAKRASNACCRIAHTIWKGIMWTRVIAMGCMTTQMIHEANYVEWDGQPKGKNPPPPKPKQAPRSLQITDRGGDHDDSTTATAQDENEGIVEITDLKMPWEKDAIKMEKPSRGGGNRSLTYRNAAAAAAPQPPDTNIVDQQAQRQPQLEETFQDEKLSNSIPHTQREGEQNNDGAKNKNNSKENSSTSSSVKVY